MEAFWGSWKVQKDKNRHIAEIGEYFGWSPDRIAMFSNLEYIIVVEPTPNGISCKVDYGEMKSGFSFQLGKPFDYTRVDGRKAKCTIVLEGGKLLETYTSDDGAVWNNIRELNGSTMTVTTTFGENGGAKSTQVLKKL